MEKTILIPEGADIERVVEAEALEMRAEVIYSEGQIISRKKTFSGNKLKEDEIKSVSIAAVRNVNISHSEMEIKGKKYVNIKMSCEIDHDSAIAGFMRKSEEEKANLAAEASKWKHEYEELKKQKANNGFYSLTDEIKQLIDGHNKITKEFEDMAIKANNEYIEFQNEQIRKKRERTAKLESSKNDVLKLIEQMKKNDDERNSDIKSLEDTAINDLNFILRIKTDDIKRAVIKAENIMEKIKLQKQKYKAQMLQHEQEINNVYDEYNKKIGRIVEENREKSEWESSSAYKMRIKIAEQLMKKYKKDKQKEISENRSYHYASYSRAITYYVENLLKIQGGFYSQSDKKRYASISKNIPHMKDENLKESYFTLNVSYEKINYKLNYYFSDSEKEKIRGLVESIRKGNKSVKAMPLFSIEEKNGKIQPKIVAFDIIYPPVGVKRIYLHRMLKDISDNKEFFTFM